jgi:hypothetical protein
LVELVEKYGPQNWTLIAQVLCSTSPIVPQSLQWQHQLCHRCTTNPTTAAAAAAVLAAAMLHITAVLVKLFTNHLGLLAWLQGLGGRNGKSCRLRCGQDGMCYDEACLALAD